MKLKNISCLITTLVMLFISNIIVLAEEAPPYTREEAYNAVFAELDVDADGEIDENLDKLIRKYDMDCIDPHLLKKEDYILFFNVIWNRDVKDGEFDEKIEDFVYDYFGAINTTFFSAAASNGKTHGEVLKDFYNQVEGMGYDVSVNRNIHANDEFYNFTSKEKAESLEKQYSRVEETTTVVKKMVNDNGGDLTEAATLSYANKTKTKPTETAQKSSVPAIFFAVSILLGLGIAVYAIVSNKKK